MKSLFLSLAFHLLLIQFLYAGESKIYPIEGPSEIPCCSPNSFSVVVENINPDFAIEGIYGKWTVKRNGETIWEVTQVPPQEELFPGESGTFTFTIPMLFLNVDGGLEIMFEFFSDFDLNEDPTASTDTKVIGCGITKEEAAFYFYDQWYDEAELRNNFIFGFDKLLKPGTVISGSGSDDFSIVLDGFFWLSLMYDPYARFEQPVMIGLLNSNTMELETVDASWTPKIDGEIFYPDPNAIDYVILAQTYTPEAPPAPMTFNPVPSVNMDSVCAILVSGVDKQTHMQSAFDHDVQMMKEYLSHHPNGPRLPESSVLIRESKKGYQRDSLLMDIMKLKNKYTKVFFYYSGHGSELGEMCIGEEETEWMHYRDFVDSLFNTNARSYCLMIDDCYAGGIIDYICADPHLPDIDVDVITASAATKVSYATSYLINQMETWYGKFTSQFFWTANDSTTDQNGDKMLTFSEIFEKIIKENYDFINDQQCPVAKNKQNRTMKILGELVYHSGELFYGNKISSATINVDPEIYSSGTLVESFDKSYQYTFPADGHIAWIQWDPNALFAKPVTYAIVDPVALNVEFHDGPSWWPVLPEYESYNPFDPDQIYANGINYITGQPLNSIFEEPPVPPSYDPANIAIIVTGTHPDPLFQLAINQSANLFKVNLLSENLGVQWHEDNIHEFQNIQVTTLESYLESLKGKEKVFFYYAGNISVDGNLALGSEPAHWMSFTNLFDKLAGIDANEYQFFFDGSYSGNALTYFPTYSFADKKVDLFTSSNSGLLSYSNFWVNEQMNMTGSLLPWTYFMMHKYGDPFIESDGLPGTTFKEAFNMLFVVNPALPNGPIFDVSSPLNFSGRYFMSPANVPETYSFQGLDLDFQSDYRASGLDIFTSQEINIRPQTTISPDVFAISPVRQWKILGNWDLDPLLAGDLIFHFKVPIDLLSGNEGDLGLVSRTSSEEEWEAYYPTEYREFNNTITAKNVTGLHEWAIAMIKTVSGLNDEIKGVSSIETYPNPANENINLSFTLDKAKHLSFRIVDLNGKAIDIFSERPFAEGAHTISFDINELMPGFYYVEIKDRNGSLYVRFVRR